MNQENMFERGAAVISIDTEQIWGHLDLYNEQEFEARFHNTREIHDRLLALLSREGIAATWTVVGMMALPGSDGPVDARLAGLPLWWTHRVRAGNEATRPLFYARSFVERLRSNRIRQDVGMHGGISHLIWGDPRVDAAIAARELRGGMEVLQAMGIRPTSFVYPRDLDRHHAVLRSGGIRCFRGRAPIASEQFGYSKFGALVRATEEVRKLVPPPVWPVEFLPGLWNLPASMSIYCLGAARCRFVPARLRVERTKVGLQAASAQRGVFHLAMHPENLAESDFAFSVFEAMVHEICRWRDTHGVEVHTMASAVGRVADHKLEGMAV
jgi:hypothetical protein